MRDALKLKVVKPRKARGPTYGPRIIAALVTCWAVLRAPAGKRLAPMLPVLVPILRRDGELDLTEEEAALVCQMSAATIDRRLAAQRAKMMPRGRSHTKPGSLLKSQIPIRTWADWDDAVPGFVEIDLVGHEGGNSSGEFCFTLTVTDIATGWTVNRSVRNKAQRWVFEALEHVVVSFPFPILGIVSDNGGEFINDHLLRWCIDRKITSGVGVAIDILPAREGILVLRHAHPATPDRWIRAEKRNQYDREFRDGAVRIVEETNTPIAQVARDLGANEGTLGNWVARTRPAHDARHPR